MRHLSFTLVPWLALLTGCADPVPAAPGAVYPAGVTAWRLDPSRRVGRGEQPLRAEFDATLRSPRVGEELTATLQVEPLIDAPKLVVRFVVPDGVTASSSTTASLDNVLAGQRYSFTFRARLESSDARPLLAAADLPFPPLASFHVQASLKLGPRDTMDPLPGRVEVIGGQRIRGVQLGPEATRPLQLEQPSRY